MFFSHKTGSHEKMGILLDYQCSDILQLSYIITLVGGLWEFPLE